MGRQILSTLSYLSMLNTSTSSVSRHTFHLHLTHQVICKKSSIPFTQISLVKGMLLFLQMTWCVSGAFLSNETPLGLQSAEEKQFFSVPQGEKYDF
jgi:hypothetical protein